MKAISPFPFFPFLLVLAYFSLHGYARLMNKLESSYMTGMPVGSPGYSPSSLNTTNKKNNHSLRQMVAELTDPQGQKTEKGDSLSKSRQADNRQQVIQKTILVHDPVITAKVWDDGVADGDIVTLFLNKECVLDSFMINKVKKEVVLHLKEGDNYLVLHAENLGKIPPNTAAIEVYEGKRKRDISMSSDLNKSGVVKIIYKPILQ